MKVLIIGLGSMGLRRLRMIRDCDATCDIIGVDLNEQRRKRAEDTHGIVTFETLEDAVKIKDISCVFVCTAPLSHNEIILFCLAKRLSVFSEINLVNDGYAEMIALAQQNSCTLFLSSTPMYRKEVQYISKRVQQEKQPLSYTFHVGQYLPDWHPWENIHDFFVANKRTNGCREIFAIELPWMIKAFGPILSVSAQKVQFLSFGLPYNDTYQVLFKHENGTVGTMNVDIVSRKAIRQLRIIGENLFLTWEGTPTTLREYDVINKMDMQVDTYQTVLHDERYSASIIENMYQEETANFFAVLRGEQTPLYSFQEDMNVLRLIDEIED